MAYGRREGFSYADDVPVKISERMKIPPRVTLPASFNPSISLDLLEDYDFSLEHEVIKLSEARRQAQKAKEKANVEKVAQEIEHFTQVKAQSSDDSRLPQPSSVTTAPAKQTIETIQNSQQHRAWQPNQMLSPEPLVQNDDPKTSLPLIKNNLGIAGGHLGVVQKTINLSDFETQSSSPFDYMELQTLNDLEELNTVFQGIVLSPDIETDRKTNSFEPSQQIPNESSDSNVFINSYNHLASMGARVETLAKFPHTESYAEKSYVDRNYVTNKETPALNHTDSYVPLNYQQPIEFNPNNETKLNFNPAYPISFNTGQAAIPSQTFDPSEPMPHYTPNTRQPFYNITANTSSNNAILNAMKPNYYDESLPRLRNSKSTSDISVPKNESGTSGWRSQTPPPSGSGHTKNYNLSSATPRPDLISSSFPSQRFALNTPRMNQVVLPTKQNIDMESLPNPFEELDGEQKEFVTALADMGFPMERTARAVKHLGKDDKKVVDHLCQVQGLEENGYNGNDAETALHLYDYNVEEAKKYLDLLGQFQDLGFHKTDVRKALVRHKNDKDKALDFLLT